MNQIDIDVTEPLTVFEFTSANQLVSQTLKNSKLFLNESINKISGISSGFSEFDKITNGFKKSELSTFAIKKGMGKTAFMLSLINNVGIKNRISLGLFSTERSSDKIISRIIESETGCSIENLNSNNFKELKKYQIEVALNQINNSNIYIDDSPYLSLDEILKKALYLRNKKNVEIIFIDCVNLFFNNKIAEKENIKKIEDIMIYFKNISIELAIPVVLFYQMEKPYDEIFHLTTPLVSDLPDFILEHADNIYIIHRSDLPYLKEDTIHQKDYCEMFITKQLNFLKNTSIKLKFLPSIDKFVDCIL